MIRSIALLVFYSILLSLVSCSGTATKETPSKEEKLPSKTLEKDEGKKSEESTSVEGLVCNLKNDMRKVVIEKGQGKGCEVFYTKFGKKRSIASSLKKSDFYCKSILNKVRANLEEAGFNCKD